MTRTRYDMSGLLELQHDKYTFTLLLCFSELTIERERRCEQRHNDAAFSAGRLQVPSHRRGACEPIFEEEASTTSSLKSTSVNKCQNDLPGSVLIFVFCVLGLGSVVALLGTETEAHDMGVISYPKQAQRDFVFYRLKIKSDKKDSSVSNEGEPGSASVSNCKNQAADEMNQQAHGREQLLFHQPQPQDDRCSSALQSRASQELEAVLQTNSTNDDCSELQSPFGDGDSCLLDGNEVSTCDEDETVCDVFPQLCDPPEKNRDSLLRPPQPQDHRPSILQSPIYTKLGNDPHPLQPLDYLPSILQSPIYTKLGNVSDANLYFGECNNWQSAFKKKVSTNEVDIPIRHILSNFENQATDYRILKVHHPQSKENLEPQRFIHSSHKTLLCSQ